MLGHRLRRFLLKPSVSHLGRNQEKYDAETAFWRREVKEYIDWYAGKKVLYETACPAEHQMVKAGSMKDSAILTWLEMHQKPKYLHDLKLAPGAFSGEKILDLGAGPMPSALCFNNCLVYCLDPLYHKYLEAGFPLHYYDNARFIHGFSEEIPVEDFFFDAVISVNALDHVDDLDKTAQEIRRVLKKGGKLAMHLHYHKSTRTEPIEITDGIIVGLFGWCEGLKKLGEARSKLGHTLDADGGVYALWKNF
jgi:ubiquinone/menaquinone biosynthesis C-methylase UbiE